MRAGEQESLVWFWNELTFTSFSAEGVYEQSFSCDFGVCEVSTSISLFSAIILLFTELLNEAIEGR